MRSHLRNEPEGAEMKVAVRLSVLLALPALCFANGGPVDGSNIVSAGGLAPLQVPEVMLVSEDLRFTPDGDWMDVEAVYTLVNGGEAVSLEYGFPVECADLYAYPEDGVLIPSELSYFTMTADGMELEVVEIDDPEPLTRTVSDRGEQKVLRKWFATTLELGAGDTLALAVSYRIRPLFWDFSTTKAVWERYSERSFTYDLDPAGRWGDGTVGDFRFVLDLSRVTQYGDSVISVPGGGEWTTASLYEIRSTDLPLAGAEPFVVTWSVDVRNTSEFITLHSIPLDLITSVTASSTLPDQGGCSYSPWNMFDGDLATAWAEGAPGDGAGEWIEITLSGYNVMEISLLGGYAKSAETFRANGRPALIEFELFEGGQQVNPWETTAELTDSEWWNAGPASFSPLVGEVTFVRDEGAPITSIRLEIDDVHPGDSCDDLCITEVFILGYPVGEPGIWWNE
jgi:hypothetical protein